MHWALDQQVSSLKTVAIVEGCISGHCNNKYNNKVVKIQLDCVKLNCIICKTLYEWFHSISNSKMMEKDGERTL